MYPLDVSAKHLSPLPIRREVLIPCFALLIIALGCCCIPAVRSWLQHTFSQINVSSLTVQQTILWIALPLGGMTALTVFTVASIKSYRKLKKGEFVAPPSQPLSLYDPIGRDVPKTGWEALKAKAISFWNGDLVNSSKPSPLWLKSIYRVLPQSKKGWIVLAAAIALFIASVTIIALGAPFSQPFHEWLNQSIPLKTGLLGGTLGTLSSLVVAATLGILIKKMVPVLQKQPIDEEHLRNSIF